MTQKEARKLWVDALRSDEYNQGKWNLISELTNGERNYCCLGVACSLYMTHGNGGLTEELEEYGSSDDKMNVLVKFTDGVQFYRQALPPQVAEWLGVRDALGKYESRKSLSELNDDDTPFSEIADIIESEPEGLFTDAASL